MDCIHFDIVNSVLFDSLNVVHTIDFGMTKQNGVTVSSHGPRHSYIFAVQVFQVILTSDASPMIFRFL